MKTLILAEKPDQAFKYCASLKPGFNESIEKKRQQIHGYVDLGSTDVSEQTMVTWGFGHLVTLKEPEDYDKRFKKWSERPLPFYPEEIEYKVPKEASKQFKLIKKLIKEANQIIIATDPDREGESIAYLILEQSKVDLRPKVLKRFWCNSQDKDEIYSCFMNLLDAKEKESLATEAKTRAIADWLVGMNLTVAYSLQAQSKKIKTIFRIGRVQTPILFLVYEREKEIILFKSQPFYTIENNLTDADVAFKNNEKFWTEKELNGFLDKAKLANGEKNPFTVKEITKEKKAIKPPSLLTLSGLQSLAQKKLAFPFAKTLELQQSLYSKEFTTYPRTSCKFITEGELKHLTQYKEDYKTFLGKDMVLDQVPGNQHVNSKKVLEHYAIIPTKNIPKKAELTEDELSLYELITERTLLMFMEDYQYNQTKMTIERNGTQFLSTGNQVISKGWKEFIEESSEKEQILPNLTEGETIELETTIKQGKTMPPSLFTETTLSGDGGALENIQKYVDDKEKGKILKEVKGLGTPATRTAILSNLVEHRYLEYVKKGKKEYLVTTKEGKALCLLVEGTLLSSPNLTAEWEERLKLIGDNQANPQDFLRNIKKFVDSELNSFPERLEEREKQIKMLVKKMPTL